MIADDRSIVRNEYAALLERELGDDVAAVFPYHLADFGGASPVVTVSSYGTLREPITFIGTKPSYRLEVNTFVLHGKPNTAWTPADCENRLDLLENKISQVNQSNQKTAHWESLQQSAGEWSEIIYIEIGGLLYASESVIVQFE